MNIKFGLAVVQNQNGATLVFTLLILAVLTVLGISASTTSRIELQLATNDYLHKQAFYAADGGTEAGTEILEQNISCPKGFEENPEGSGQARVGNVQVVKRNFWENTLASLSYPSDSNRDVYLPYNYGSKPHTNLTIGGNTIWTKGGAIQMAAGYESKGKGAPGGGAIILYDVYSQRIGQKNSRSLVRVQWRHVIGQEGECLY